MQEGVVLLMEPKVAGRLYWMDQVRADDDPIGSDFIVASLQKGIQFGLPGSFGGMILTIGGLQEL